jgi:hypothetical protein
MAETRNETICREYRAGKTLEELGKDHSISRERVRQILRKAGINKQDRHVEVNTRDVFLGLHVSEDVKAALRVEADRRGVTMSELSNNTLSEMLIACGYPLEAEQVAARAQQE